jgi:hypothetical protein
MQNLVRGFIYSAGVIFLFVATALFLVNLTSPADLAPINDPIFHAPVPRLFWIVGGIGLAVALVCLFARNSKLQTTLILLFASVFLGFRICVSVLGVSHGFKGYLGSLADAFGIQASSADALLTVVSLYLLIGCFLSRLAPSGREAGKGTGETTRKAA